MLGCNHYWNYDHAVYSDSRGGSLVRRCCIKCKQEMVGEVTRWREPKPEEFDSEFAIDNAKASCVGHLKFET